MPPVYRRHYSWPFGGPTTNTHEEHHRQTADLRVVKNMMSQEENRFASFQPVPENPLSIGDLYEEDDAISAGIVRSESTSSRHSRLWPRSHSEEAAEWHKRGGGGGGGSRKEDTTIVSSVTEAEELPIAMLRRLLWSRLEKARLHSVRTANNKSVAHRDDIMITVTSPLHLTEEVTWIGELKESDRLNDDHRRRRARSRWERKHRRCHSEQPRSWREPGPGLWTLVEEEPSGS
jgi:hypothetical protein